MKSSQINLYSLLGGTVAAFASAANSAAMEASDVLVFTHGPLSLRPQLAVVEQFSDNIFYNNTSQQADLISTISPGLKLLVGTDLPTENHLKVAYNLEALFYVDHSALNTTQHKFLTDTRYQWTRLTLQGSDRVELLSSILGGGFSITGPTAFRNVDRMTMWDTYRVHYKIGERMGVYLDGEHLNTDFESGIPLFDTRTLIGTLGFEYQYSEDTFFFGEVYYGDTTLHPNISTLAVAPGTTFEGGFIGARGHFTEKLTGSIKAGYQITTFSGTLPVGTDKSAGSAPVVETAISYQATERMTATLSYSRRQQVSVQFVRSSYTADSIGATLTEVLGSSGRLRLDLTALYAMYSFDPAPAYPGGRNDSSWKAQLGASYFFQTWMAARLEYSFERFTSDYAQVIDYDVNRVTLSLAIGY